MMQICAQGEAMAYNCDENDLIKVAPHGFVQLQPVYRDQKLSARITRGMFVASYNKIIE